MLRQAGFALVVVASLCGLLHVAQAQTPDTRKDEDAIKAVMTATTEAFSRQDAKAWVKYCTDDAQLVTVRGESMKGVAEIEKGLAAIFRTRARQAVLKTRDVSVRFTAVKPNDVVSLPEPHLPIA